MEMKKYQIGEVFLHNGELYQAIALDRADPTPCVECPFLRDDCPPCRGLMFKKVTQPALGMLYRTADGKLWELLNGRSSAGRCVCSISGGEKICLTISDEVFNGMGGHPDPDWQWILVDDPKAIPTAPTGPIKPAEEPRRYLELAIVKIEDDTVTFKIAKQTHRNGSFTTKGDRLDCINGETLHSVAHPATTPVTFFVRGQANALDDYEATCTTARWAKICEAVQEYNATNGEGYPKPWPQKGDAYFYLNIAVSKAQVGNSTWSADCIDEGRKALGNFFRTREEAEAALVRVRETLRVPTETASK